MCYSAEAATRKLIKYALHRGDTEYAKALEQYLIEISKDKTPKFFVSGFAHPELLVFTNEEPMKPQYFTWGLIPSWVKDWEGAKKQRRNTLNARVETMFEKPSFKDSAFNRRCLVYFDAFYEYHTFNKKKYPIRVSMREDIPMVMGGIWNSWVDKATGEIHNTVAVCTTDANALMEKVHNEPAASDTPRMPVIISKEDQDKWLIKIRTKKDGYTEADTQADVEFIKSIAAPYDGDKMQAWTVAPLIGKKGLGNAPEARLEYKYEELIF
ncbi:SOS response-associated peptidase [Aurantibacillus circumpalustris]|uniref:SOS response-associated peptidase n=1 Tax=Aurantibacillus circumpalustris TaxID=3036359 RepID=UPI00295B640D|nr:SOS response-associated peptidase [Aurantibacillus circumpalustris]